ncbi:hypothetical protein OS493_019343 [Desmophyllum pertusum]|uniref:Uncharacterized protein n=1 Tax=Desmophyllum pertusum TaxID=174260 RepID=A0A9X0D8F9_9CNID|nr:hypothetical protein OS493_019343 [Desmophyllum pertusum]
MDSDEQIETEEKLAQFFTNTIDESILDDSIVDQNVNLPEENATGADSQQVEVNITPKILNSLKRTLCTEAEREEETKEKKKRLKEEIIKGKEIAAKMMRLSRKFQQTIKKIDELNQ